MRKTSLFFTMAILISLSTQIPLGAQEYGLVLSGGGGKGAYEVGVWKALNEYGVAQRITEISGTSVGGLNAALFACYTPQEAEDIWRNIVPKTLTTTTGKLRETLISQPGLKQIIIKVPLTKLQENRWPHVTVTALPKRNALAKLLSSAKPCENATRFVLNGEPDLSEIQNRLLATSAFPFVTNPIKLKDGIKYTDGGEESAGGDNTPIDPVVANANVHTIFIVYLSDLSRLTRRIRQIDYSSVKLIEIIPSIDLGSMLEGTVNFTSERIGMLIDKGYEDAVNVLKEKGYTPINSYWFDK
jgi:NTE family protein